MPELKEMCLDHTFKTGFGLSQLIYHPPSVANGIHVLNRANQQPIGSLLTSQHKHWYAKLAALVQGRCVEQCACDEPWEIVVSDKAWVCCASETDAKSGARPDVVEVDLSIVAVAGFVAFSLAPHSLYIGFIEVGIRDEDHSLNG